MSTRRIVCAVIAAFGLAAAGQADVIGDFEGALDPGWSVTSGTGVISSNWSSSGSSSLQVTPGAEGFAWALNFDNAAVVQELATTHLLQMDVHWITEEWLPNNAGAWVRWDNVSLNSSGGWAQTADGNITDPANPSYPGSWDPINWGESHTRTMTFDIASLGSTPDGTWGQLNLSFNLGSNDTIGSLYIDNVQTILIPEPGTLALLGVGVMALAFSRRRRQG